MSGQRRRPTNPGGEQPPGRGPDSGRPYAYGSPVEGAPSYDRSGGDELRSEGIRRGVRETAQQPRLTRAEMRRQGGRRGGPADAGGPGGPGGAGGAGGSGGGGRRGGGAGSGPGGRDGKPGKKRFIDYPRFGKSGFKRWIPSWKQVITLFLVFFGGGVAAVGAAYAMTPVPNPKDLIHDQNNIYYWADGSEMTRKGDTNRQLVELSAISRPAQDAVIAAENETFRTDSGIDPKGIARAVYNMATGGETQGGSTITQQYVKNAYLSQDQTLTRKLKEFFITLKINGEKGKDEILTGYLNTSWYGRGSTGIQAAAQAYYGVDAKDLNACQGAMLAGLLKGAALYDPSLSTANHDRAVARWKWILDRMVVTKALTQDERNKCTDFPDPVKQKASATMNGEVYYLVETANKYLTSKDPSLTQQVIDRGGFQIYTTFEKDKVDALKKAVDDVKSESLKPDKREADKFVQVGAASVVPGDGRIVAIYGGDGIENGHYTNNADSTGIPVGSTFKPFVLATAMQYGVLTQNGPDGKPARINSDSQYLADDKSEIHNKDGAPVMGDDGKPYHQKNDSPGKPGYVTLKKAMQFSYNVPFVQLGQDVGGSNVEKMVLSLGLRKESLAPSSTITYPLGTSTPSAIRMASAYSVFAARGQQNDPYSVGKVLKDGKELPTFAKNPPKTVLDQAVADNITDVLENVAKAGTGTKTNQLGRPVAGKTGTTDAGTSAWWTGYTPQLATSVGMWREEPGKPQLLSLNGTAGHESVHGGDFPTDIFTRYMKVALANQPKADFPDPEPFGQQVNSSGFSASPSASASDSASPTAAATAPTDPTPSATTGPSPSTSPSASASQTCLVPGLCPTRGPKPSKSGTATGTATDTAPASPGGVPGQ
ncbi:transglycosylase domain-containing protein [Kitasatospora paracochleata]|uniref:Membrane peptidoglycan carboxypeptidase n=1 Tax=Kitasatospora paracochleata TaxID=58354 RepID=A0ABT1J6T4_9ACTN|nr:transglycosylase domain-containing protein [Kitasatospora paracochleata]MCP2313152.1 membrane peptidoglycan carboxypeptidase [Kitasatospora paracochleata]